MIANLPFLKFLFQFSEMSVDLAPKKIFKIPIAKKYSKIRFIPKNEPPNFCFSIENNFVVTCVSNGCYLIFTLVKSSYSRLDCFAIRIGMILNGSPTSSISLTLS